MYLFKCHGGISGWLCSSSQEMGWKLQSFGKNMDLNPGARGKSQCTVNYSTQFLFTHGFCWSSSHFQSIPFLQ